MSELKVGDAFPAGVNFSWAPITPDSSDVASCGIIQKYDTGKEFAGKKVVIIAVPGAFTPTCQESHLPSYVKNKDSLKAKGVEKVIIIASNDAWVMAAWAKANGITDDFYVFASDPNVAFSKSIGWFTGDRTQRYAIVVDNGKVTYAARETAKGTIENSGADAVLAKL